MLGKKCLLSFDEPIKRVFININNNTAELFAADYKAPSYVKLAGLQNTSRERYSKKQIKA